MLNVHSERVCSVLIIVLHGGSWKLFCMSNAMLGMLAAELNLCSPPSASQPNFLPNQPFYFLAPALWTNAARMPKENKKRGRREENEKRKRQQQDEEAVSGDFKRHKIQNEDWKQDEIALNEDASGYSLVDNGQSTHEFFGLLDDEEQAYFKRAAQILDLNEFVTGSSEERDAFLAGVWKECQGKELKLASSQSCSRLLEKLIQYATSDQLKSLFQSFSGHFTYLISHRFASHCCEMLFQRTAPLVTEELLTPFQVITAENQSNATSTESLFLTTIAELHGNFGYLMTDSFASHSVRVLLLVLSGRPLASLSAQSLLQSKKKESKAKLETGIDTASRPVPASFHAAFNETTQDMIGSLDSNYLRALATHPLGNPVLQLLLEIEFSTAAQSKDKSRDSLVLFSKLFPHIPMLEGTESAQFLRGLMFDPVGSHLLETIIRNCPGKFFKPIWSTELRPKLIGMIKNDSAVHILARAVERLSPEDLQEVTSSILPEIPALLDRMQYSILKTLIERTLIRNIDAGPIFDGISDYFALKGIETVLKSKDDNSVRGENEQDVSNETKRQALQKVSVFFQEMIKYDSSIRRLLFDTFKNMEPDILITIGKNKYATFVLQRSLEIGDKVYRRIVVQKLVVTVTDLALDEIGSHVLDSLWKATLDLQFLREKIATQLSQHETQLRDSYTGRLVWRNWMMDLYMRRKQSWIEKSKHVDQSLSDGTNRTEATTQAAKISKTSIQVARERFAAKQSWKIR